MNRAYLLLLLGLSVFLMGSTRFVPPKGNVIGRSVADCTAETQGATDDICFDTDGAGAGLWRCPSPGDCSGTTAWVRVDNTSATLTVGGEISGTLDNVNIDTEELSDETWGSGTDFTWTFGTSGIDPSISFGAGLVAISSGLLEVGDTDSDGKLRIWDADSGGDSTVSILIPDVMGTSWNLTLPPDNGDFGELLKTSGSGLTAWETIDIANLSDGTDGELITWDAAGGPTTVAVGTANQVLTSNGAGAAPTFENTGFTLAGDSGSEPVAADDTLSILGGTGGIDVAVTATDTATVTFDPTEVGSVSDVTWGDNSRNFVWTFNTGGVNDKTMIFADGTLSLDAQISYTNVARFIRDLPHFWFVDTQFAGAPWFFEGSGEYDVRMLAKVNTQDDSILEFTIKKSGGPRVWLTLDGARELIAIGDTDVDDEVNAIYIGDRSNPTFVEDIWISADDIHLVGDVAIEQLTGNGNGDDINQFVGVVKSSGFALGSVIADGSETVTTDYGGDIPSDEWTATANMTAADDSVTVRKGGNSLKVTVGASPAAGNGVDNVLAMGDQDWSGDESFGMWHRCDTTYNAGDWVLGVTDNASEDVTTTFPAYGTADAWVWIELEIGSIADADKDVITDIAIDLSTAGATTFAAGGICHFDYLFKWDAEEETALGLDVLEDGVDAVWSITTANSGSEDRTPVFEVEGTDYFIHYETGNDFLVPITDLSDDSLWGHAYLE